MAQWKVNYNDLTFDQRIGKGNFGEVYRGTYLGTDVAIKKLFFVDDDFMQKYIEREMDTLTGLSHPNIVQLMGLCIETDDMYIITEFISGGDLRSKLKDTSVEMDWNLRVSIARDVALALNYLHSKNIMHRDLKSHNLLVSENWKVKVCDFGLARSAPDDETEKNNMTIVGTNEWMAPEVAMQENYDKSADVFSFGMVLYELITRDKPPARKLKDCYGFNADEHKKNIPADTPPALWDLLVKCAALNGEDRPTIKEVVDELKKIQDSLASGAPAAAPAAASSSTAKSAPAAAPAAAEGEKKKKKKKTTTTAAAGAAEGEKKKKKKKKSTEGAEKKSSPKTGEKKKKKKKSTEGGEGEKKKKKTSTKKTSTKKE
ncbi:Nucleolar protein NOP5, putative, expressed [Balamuthia mandrillaris]